MARVPKRRKGFLVKLTPHTHKLSYLQIWVKMMDGGTVNLKQGGRNKLALPSTADTLFGLGARCA